MRSLWFSLVVASALTIGGCGGGKSMLGPPIGTTVNLGFSNGTPQAAAVQIGSGSFTTAPVQNGQVSLILPPGTTKYAVAYVCPPVTTIASTISGEFVIEATIQDGTSFTLSCGGPPPTGSATGSVDASSVPGANNVLVTGSQGFATFTGLTSSFNVNLPAGTNDVAAVVVDGMLKV